MKPEGSLPHSQEPVTGSYAKPDTSSPHIFPPFINSAGLNTWIEEFKECMNLEFSELLI
jgi:hypothetical protein